MMAMAILDAGSRARLCRAVEVRMATLDVESVGVLSRTGRVRMVVEEAGTMKRLYLVGETY